MKEIIEKLEYFGISKNAARAYCALLKMNPATGYEVSVNAEIPRSAVYNVLNKLESKGLVSGVGNKPKKYIPLPPSSLLEQFDHVHQESLGDLKTSLENMDLDDEAFDFWHIHGYKNLIFNLKETITNARGKLFISAWQREIKKLEIELDKAQERGVELTLFSFCRINKQYGETISYNLDENDLRKIWAPKVIMVADHTTTIMGSAKNNESSRAIKTQNEAITEIATNHIVLDITLASNRLDIKTDSVVKRILKKPDIDLDRLLNI